MLQGTDFDLIIDSINNDEDQLKLFFGVKALRNILTVCSKLMSDRIIMKYGIRVSKRLVHILNYEHMEELMTEALKCLLLIISANDERINLEFVVVGIVPTL